MNQTFAVLLNGNTNGNICISILPTIGNLMLLLLYSLTHPNPQAGMVCFFLSQPPMCNSTLWRSEPHWAKYNMSRAALQKQTESKAIL